jgi:hypothetical protein
VTDNPHEIHAQLAVLATNVGHLTEAVKDLKGSVVTRPEHEALEERTDRLESTSTWATRGILAALAGVAANVLGIHLK